LLRNTKVISPPVSAAATVNQLIRKMDAKQKRFAAELSPACGTGGVTL